MQECREDGTIVPHIEVQFGNRTIEVRDPFRTVSQIEELLVTQWIRNNNLGAWLSYHLTGTTRD